MFFYNPAHNSSLGRSTHIFNIVDDKYLLPADEATRSSQMEQYVITDKVADGVVMGRQGTQYMFMALPETHEYFNIHSLTDITDPKALGSLNYDRYVHPIILYYSSAINKIVTKYAGPIHPRYNRENFK